MLDRRVDPAASIQVQAADLSARDNAALAIATQAASRTFFDLFDRGLINREELLRMVYRFAGEIQAQDSASIDLNDPARQSVGSSGTGKTSSTKVIDPVNAEPRGVASLSH